jgi:hypothetical protein
VSRQRDLAAASAAAAAAPSMRGRHARGVEGVRDAPDRHALLPHGLDRFATRAKA